MFLKRRLEQWFLTRGARNVPRGCGIDEHGGRLDLIFYRKFEDFVALYLILHPKLDFCGRDDFFLDPHLILRGNWDIGEYDDLFCFAVILSNSK